MYWLVAIDIKIWEDFSMLNKILSCAKEEKMIGVLFNDNLYDKINKLPENWLIYKMLSEIDLDSFEDRPPSANVIFSPNILNGLKEDEKSITKNIGYSILKRNEPPHKLYDISKLRVNTGTVSGFLSISSGKLRKNISLIIETDGEDIVKHIEKNSPKLEQAKHIAQQTRYLGKRKVASTFKAWDPRDESYAEELLKKAFKDSDSNVLPPSSIYIWDSKNETYVRFLHSGNWEYHGHDVEDYNEVPDKIKKRYNHWKK